jgi:hypothetical protein
MKSRFKEEIKRRSETLYFPRGRNSIIFRRFPGYARSSFW